MQALVWVRLLELPLEFWNEDVFRGVANSFGELLSIHSIIASRSRLTYAWICIGVREGDYMPEVVSFHSKLGTHTQQLDYESVHFSCFHFLKSGHKANQFPKVKAEKKRIPSSSNLGKEKKIRKKKDIKGGQKNQKNFIEALKAPIK